MPDDTPKPRFQITLEALPDDNPVPIANRIRNLLKELGRRHRLKCVEVREIVTPTEDK